MKNWKNSTHIFGGFLCQQWPKSASFPRHSSFEQICEVAEKERKKLYESMSQPSSPTQDLSCDGMFYYCLEVRLVSGNEADFFGVFALFFLSSKNKKSLIKFYNLSNKHNLHILF
jgi:hypothetical protein